MSGQTMLGGGRENAGAPSRVTALERWLVRRLLDMAGRPPVAVALWDGEDVEPGATAPAGRIVIRDRATLWSTLISPELGFGDHYSAGRIEVSGDLVEVLYRLFCSMEEKGATTLKRTLLGRLPKSRSNTRSGSRHHIQHHYDLGNDFYRLWLDEHMVYTCAYYPTPDTSLEDAQVAKMEHVCRKVQLRPGQMVIEAGCGWGSLALYMARNYGVRVRAFNISSEQIAHARERARDQGLSEQVEFIEDDYRNISGRCDAFVSVGMLEHVGLDNYAELGRVIARSLEPAGRGLIHTVARPRPCPPNAWLERRIFPGSHPPSLGETMRIFEPSRFSILDVENLRLHYAKTLIDWLARFDAQLATVRKRYDEEFVRAWRLYLGGCAAGFLASSIQLYQIVFALASENHLPMTREHVYGAPASTWRLTR